MTLLLDNFLGDPHEDLLSDIDHFILIDVIFIVLHVLGHVSFFTIVRFFTRSTARDATLRTNLRSWALLELVLTVSILVLFIVILWLLFRLLLHFLELVQVFLIFFLVELFLLDFH